MQILSERIKGLRIEHKFSQAKVARMLGIKPQSYFRYEDNTSEPNAENIVKLAKFYDVTTDYLLGLTNY